MKIIVTTSAKKHGFSATEVIEAFYAGKIDNVKRHNSWLYILSYGFINDEEVEMIGKISGDTIIFHCMPTKYRRGKKWNVKF